MRWLMLGIVVGICCLSEGSGQLKVDQMEARLVAVKKTKTALSLVTFTTTAPLTCALATLPAICQRRRYRRFTAINDQLFDAEAPTVEASLQDDEVNEKNSETALRDPRIALTVVVTSSSTVSITVTSTNTAVTFSLSFFCTVSGASYPPACG